MTLYHQDNDKSKKRVSKQQKWSTPSHHEHMVADFRKRFWISLVLTPPILLLSPTIQKVLGFGDSLRFRGDLFLLFALSSVLFLYGGLPFLKGFKNEVSTVRPGMMTLVTLAITTAYLCSSAVVFGLEGKIFYWELATLIDVMLLGHWYRRPQSFIRIDNINRHCNNYACSGKQMVVLFLSAAPGRFLLPSSQISCLQYRSTQTMANARKAHHGKK